VGTPRPWPAPLVELHAQPDEAAPPWAEHVQGITHHAGHWFVTQEDRLWRVPVQLDLERATAEHPSVAMVGIPEAGIGHLGDCDVYDGRLYVAMEGTDPARVGVFGLDLSFCGSAATSEQGTQLPWCAVNPGDGLLYSSPFDADRLHRYRRAWNRGRLELEYVGEVPLRSGSGEPMHVQRLQGGAFSPRGHLFLTSDSRSGGILGIDMTTGRREMQVPIPFEPRGPDEDVIEGLAIVDLSDGRVPWMRGILHVLAFAADETRRDCVWLRHYDVADERDRAHFHPPAERGQAPG